MLSVGELLVDVFLRLKISRVFYTKQGVGRHIVDTVCPPLQKERDVQVHRFRALHHVVASFKGIVQPSVLETQSWHKPQPQVTGQGVRGHQVHIEASLRHVGHATKILGQAVGDGEVEVALVSGKDESKVVGAGVKVGKVFPSTLAVCTVHAQHGEQEQHTKRRERKRIMQNEGTSSQRRKSPNLMQQHRGAQPQNHGSEEVGEQRQHHGHTA